MNRRSIVLKILCIKPANKNQVFSNGFFHICLSKTCFLEQTFLGASSGFRIFASNFLTIEPIIY